MTKILEGTEGRVLQAKLWDSRCSSLERVSDIRTSYITYFNCGLINEDKSDHRTVMTTT